MMRKYATHLFISTILTLTIASVSYSQTSPTSTPATDRAAIVSLCERAKDEVVASRERIGLLENALKATEDGKALSEAEATQLRDSLASEKAAMAKEQLAVKTYQKKLASETKKKNFYKRMFEITGAMAVAGAAIIVIGVTHR